LNRYRAWASTNVFTAIVWVTAKSTPRDWPYRKTPMVAPAINSEARTIGGT
jgi:hypothetical protein